MKKIMVAVLLTQLLFGAAYSADFLTGARSGGMGFSYFVLADDPSGALYNPAALGFTQGWQSQFMYNIRNNYGYTANNEDPYYGLIGAVYNKPEWGTVSLNSVQSGSLLKGGDVPTVDYFTLSFGREFAPGLAMGTSVKYLSEYGYLERTAFDFDFGINYRTTANIILAISGENLARSKLTPVYLNLAERLPRRARLGGAYIQESGSFQAAFLLAGQLEESGITEKYTTFLTNIGTEWWFNQYGQFSFGTRLGYTFGKGVVNDFKGDYGGISGGISLNYKIGTNDIRLDYSIETFPYETVDGSNPLNHYLAFNIGWGGVPSYNRSDTPEEFVQRPPMENPKPAPAQLEEEEEEEEVPRTVENNIDSDTEFDAMKFERYNVDMDVSDISSLDAKRIVFYLRPQNLISTNSWKLYVFKAKIKKWNDAEIDRWALKVIDGKGIPPINVVWDGISRDGRMLPSGKYYFILTAVDQQGRNFATSWQKFDIR